MQEKQTCWLNISQINTCQESVTQLSLITHNTCQWPVAQKKIIQLNHRSYYLLSMHSYNPIIFPLSISPITPPVSQWTLQRPPPLSAYPMLSTKFSLPLCLPLYICLSFSLSISQSLSLSVSLFLSIHEASHYVIEACATLPLCPWSYLTSSFLSCSSLDLPNLLTGHYIISFTLVDTNNHLHMCIRTTVVCWTHADYNVYPSNITTTTAAVLWTSTGFVSFST